MTAAPPIGPSAPVDPRQVFAPGTVLGGRYRLDGLIVPDAPVFFASDLERGLHVVVQAVFDPAVAQRAPELHRWLRSQNSAWMAPTGLAVLDTGLEPTSGAAFVVIQLPTDLPPVGFVDPEGPVQLTLRHWLSEMFVAIEREPEPPTPMVVPEDDEGTVRIQRGGLILAGALTAVAGIYLLTAEDRVPPGADTSQEGIVRRTNWIEGSTPNRRRFAGDPNKVSDSEGKEDVRRLPRIVVDSTPQGALVFDGGRNLGATPVRVGRPADGERIDLRLSKPGYLDKSFSVSSRDPNRVSATLFRTGESAGTPSAGGVEKPSILIHPDLKPGGSKKPAVELPALGEME